MAVARFIKVQVYSWMEGGRVGGPREQLPNKLLNEVHNYSHWWQWYQRSQYTLSSCILASV